MYVTDEEMQVITDVSGNVYNYWNTLFNSGNTSNQGYDMILSQTIDFLYNNKIKYSVDNSSYLETTGIGNRYVNVSEGYIVNSSNQTVKFIDQDLYIDHLYSYNYDTDGYYGVIIGIYYNDIDSNSTLYRSYLTNLITAGDTSIYIKDISIFNDISFPCILQINTEQILISSVNILLSTAIVSVEYNGGSGVVNSYASGLDVFAYNKLEAQMIFGAPVAPAFVPVASATGFKYYPPTPDDMLVLAKVLVRYPVTPSTYNRNVLGNPLADTEIIDIDTSMKLVGAEAIDQPFTTIQQDAIYNYYNLLTNTKSLITYNSALYSLCNSMNNINYEDINQYDYSNTSFESYWNHRPVTRSSYLKYGVQWDDFERFEFSDGFKRLWYSWSGTTQLLTTLAIFSGNLMDSRYTSGVDAPQNLILNSDEVAGALGPGTWSYAVTVVTASGESPLSDFESVSIASNKPQNRVLLSWDAVAGAIYYNVYRRASENSVVSDLRLTADNELITNSYVDMGGVYQKSSTTRRGVILTGGEIYSDSGSELYYYVPKQSISSSLYPIQGLSGSIGSTTETTQNGVNITLTLEKPDGTIETLAPQSIPAGTVLGTSLSVNSGVLYKKIIDMQVELIDGDLDIIGSRVNWSEKDIIFIQNIA